MSRKSIVITILLVFVSTLVFADGIKLSLKDSAKFRKESISFRASFVSTQVIMAGREHRSTSGLSVEGGYRYNIRDGLVVGGDLKYSTFNFTERRAKYLVLTLSPKIGWTQKLDARWTVSAVLGVGAQLRYIGDRHGIFFGVNLYLGAGYAIRERFVLTAGAEADLAFQKNSKDLTIDPMIGFAYLF